jgi:hypothetical protein
VRMLVNSLFWIRVAVVGLAIWTSTLPQYNRVERAQLPQPTFTLQIARLCQAR